MTTIKETLFGNCSAWLKSSNSHRLQPPHLLGGLIAVVGLMILPACGPSKYADGNSASGSSISLASTDTSSLTSASKTIAICNRRNMGFMDLSLKADTSATSATVGKYILGKLNSLSTELVSDTGYSIYFFRGRTVPYDSSSTDTVVKIDDSALKVAFFLPSGSGVSIETDRINYAVLSNMKLNLGLYNSSLQGVMDQAQLSFRLNDSSANSYKFIRAALYDSNNNVKSYRDILIPAFYADPADYATDPTTGGERSAALTALHPFANMTGDYVRLANQLCSSF